jgi:hypothetical protein
VLASDIDAEGCCMLWTSVLSPFQLAPYREQATWILAQVSFES